MDDIGNPNTKEICKGCSKLFDHNTILKHVSHSKKCKAAYGESYEQLKKVRALEQKRQYKNIRKLVML